MSPLSHSGKVSKKNTTKSTARAVAKKSEKIAVKAETKRIMLSPPSMFSESSSARLGQRNTRPRAAIAGILESARGPLTVAEIHAQAQKADSSATIGIATVYRTLNLLVENGLAQTVMLPSGETRYEAAGHKGHHDHFQCVNCAVVYDIDACQLDLPADVVIAGGFRVQGHELTLTGLCPECDEPEKKPRKSAVHPARAHKHDHKH